MLKRYLIYLLRWQLSTPILAVCVTILSPLGNIWATIIANFAGGLIFFWIDRIIFSKKRKYAIWSIMAKTVSADCGRTGRGYRLVESGNYDRNNDQQPQFRCESCSIKKADQLSGKGVATT